MRSGEEVTFHFLIESTLPAQHQDAAAAAAAGPTHGRGCVRAIDPIGWPINNNGG